MSNHFEPSPVRAKDIPIWIRESWSLMWRRPVLFFPISILYHLLTFASRTISYVALLVSVLICYVFTLLIINFAEAADNSRNIELLPNYYKIRNLIVSLLIFAFAYIVLFLVAAIVSNLVSFNLPSVDYSDRQIYVLFRWVWPGKVSFMILYLGIVVSAMWLLPPLLSLHELKISDAKRLARKAEKLNEWPIFLASYLPLVLVIALSLVTEVSFLLSIFFVPLFPIYMYVAYRHIFLGKRDNVPIPAKKSKLIANNMAIGEQLVAATPNKSFKFVPALRASTGPKKAAPFWSA